MENNIHLSSFFKEHTKVLQIFFLFRKVLQIQRDNISLTDGEENFFYCKLDEFAHFSNALFAAANEIPSSPLYQLDLPSS